MKIVAIETATAASSVALGDGGEIVATAGRLDRRGHVGFLVPALDFCFAQARWKPDDIEVVAVDVGPGLFGGIRDQKCTFRHGLLQSDGGRTKAE